MVKSGKFHWFLCGRLITFETVVLHCESVSFYCFGFSTTWGVSNNEITQKTRRIVKEYMNDKWEQNTLKVHAIKWNFRTTFPRLWDRSHRHRHVDLYLRRVKLIYVEWMIHNNRTPLTLGLPGKTVHSFRSRWRWTTQAKWMDRIFKGETHVSIFLFIWNHHGEKKSLSFTESTLRIWISQNLLIISEIWLIQIAKKRLL